MWIGHSSGSIDSDNMQDCEMLPNICNWIRTWQVFNVLSPIIQVSNTLYWTGVSNIPMYNSLNPQKRKKEKEKRNLFSADTLK